MQKIILPKRPKGLGLGIDTDGDWYPDNVDCKPRDKNKQGPISWIKAKTSGRTHEEVERERLQEKIELEADREKTSELKKEYESKRGPTVLSNISEVKTRLGYVIAVAFDDDEEIKEKVELMITKNIKFDDKLYGFTDTSKRILDIFESEIAK